MDKAILKITNIVLTVISIVSVPDEDLSFLVEIVEVEVAVLAEVGVLAVLERVVEGDPLGVLKPAAVALPPPHPALEHRQRVPVLPHRLGALPLRDDVHVLEDDDVVAALEVAEEVGPPEDHPQALDLGLGHFVDGVGVLGLGAVLLEVVVGEGDDFVDLLVGGVAVVVEVVLDEAVGVGPVDGLLALEAGDQAVELADHFQQRLLPVAEVLVHLLAVDAVVETEVDEGLARRQAVAGCEGGALGLFLPELPQVERVYHVLLVLGHPVVLVAVDLVRLEVDVLGLLWVELALDLVKVQLSREVVDLLGLTLHILDVLGRTLDYLVLSCGSLMGTFVVGENFLPDFGGLRVGVVHHFLEALF